MNLSIVDILHRGNPDKERLWIAVLAGDNLNYYAVFDTEYQDGGIAAMPKRAYWFTDHPVRPGDRVYLYTKAGNDFVKPRADGSSSHFFYWGLRRPLWADEKNCAVLVNIRDWQTSPQDGSQ
jgi:hypothetical protein